MINCWIWISLLGWLAAFLQNIINIRRSLQWSRYRKYMNLHQSSRHHLLNCRQINLILIQFGIEFKLRLFELRQIKANWWRRDRLIYGMHYLQISKVISYVIHPHSPFHSLLMLNLIEWMKIKLLTPAILIWIPSSNGIN